MLFIKRKLGGADGPERDSGKSSEPITIEGEVVTEPTPEVPPLVARKKSLFGKKPKPEAGADAEKEAKPSKKAASLLERMGRKPCGDRDEPARKAERASESVAEAEVVESAPEAVKPREKKVSTKPAKPEKAKRRPATRGGKPAYVAVVLDGTGDAVWWEVSGDTLVRMPDPPAAGTAVVFSRDDIRIAADKPMSHQDALGLAFQETGEDAAVANASRSHGVIYATGAARVTGSSIKVIPGLLVLEAVAKANGLEAPDVGGFDLPLGGGGTALLVLAALHAKEGLGKNQVTLNPENRQFSIDQFVSQLKGAQGGVTLFGLSELLAAAATLPRYPTEPMVLWGLPKSKAWLGAIALSGALAAGAGGLYLYIEGATHLMERRAEAAQQAEKAAAQAAAYFVENRVHGLVEKASLDVGRSFRDASSVWVPRSMVRMDANLSGGTTLTVVFSPSGPKTTKQYVFSATQAEIDSFLARTKVGDCARISLSINGATNEITAAYQCPNPGSPIPGYGLD